MPPKKLHEAVKSGSIDNVRRYLRTESPNDRDQYHQTPLHVACNGSNADIVRLLLRKKADVNVQDRNGWTPLHCGASGGSLDILEVLLMVDGIDVGVLNKDGTSALHYLVRLAPMQEQKYTYCNVLKLYADKGGDVNSQTKHGEAALHQACMRGNITAVSFLLEHNANIDIVNKIGETSLHYAVRGAKKEIIELLLTHEADVNIVSEDGPPTTSSPNAEITQFYEDAVRKMKNPNVNLDQNFDFTEYNLIVKVIRAEKFHAPNQGDTNPFCQIQFGKQRKTTTVKNSTLAPKWNEVFSFNVEDKTAPLKFQIFHQEGDKAPTKDDLLGSVAILLEDLPNLIAKNSTTVRDWFALKKGRTKKGKIRLEFSFSKNEEEDNNAEDEDVTIGVFGWVRGECTQPDCDCEEYHKETNKGGPCQNCGHYPAKHKKLNSKPKKDPESEPDQKELPQPKEKKSLDHLLQGKNSWMIDYSELQLDKLLGEGTSAKVYKGTYRCQEVAIKILKEKAEEKAMQEFIKEFDIMRNFKGKDIVYFYGACLEPSVCMVLEFLDKGSLYDVLNDMNEVINWDRVFKAALDTIRGLICLHAWKPVIVHRDLKTLNLLVDKNDVVKVCDFGLSRFTEETENQADLQTLGKLRGTYAYCCPEVYFGKDYTPKSDVFSMGVIFWEMAYRAIRGEYEQPYAEFTQIQFDFQIIIQTAKNDLRPTIPKETPKPYVEIIERCWHKDPEARPSSLELISLTEALYDEYKRNKEEWDAILTPPKTKGENAEQS